MTSDPEPRPETAADAEAIDRVLAAAFGRSDEARLVRDLRAAGALALSLVVQRDGDLAGYLACSPVTVQGGSVPGLLGLGPLAVAPPWQRQGLGSALVEAAMQRLKAEGNRLVVVLGDPAFYRRFGFRPAAGLGLDYPGAVPTGAFQALPLAPPLVRGLVRYHRAFDGL